MDILCVQQRTIQIAKPLPVINEAARPFVPKTQLLRAHCGLKCVRALLLIIKLLTLVHAFASPCAVSFGAGVQRKLLVCHQASVLPPKAFWQLADFHHFRVFNCFSLSVFYDATFRVRHFQVSKLLGPLCRDRISFSGLKVKISRIYY